MRIITWNVNALNGDVSQLGRLIVAQNPDVICLQEVNATFFKHIEKVVQGYDMVYARDNLVPEAVKGLPHYLVVLSRFPLKGQKIVKLPVQTKVSRVINRLKTLSDHLEGHIVSVQIPGYDKPWQLAHAHLSCNAPPSARKRELEALVGAMEEDAPRLVCGDFNTFGTPIRNILAGKIYGMKRGEILRHELRDMQRWMGSALGMKHAVYEGRPMLARILSRKATRPFAVWPLLSLRLDHIFVDENVPVVGRKVMRRRYGSDHRPVMAILQPEARHQKSDIKRMLEQTADLSEGMREFPS